MLRRVHRSLFLRLSLALTMIALMALLGIVTSVVVAQQLRGAATAINHAGALRFTTYAASTTALRPEVEDIAAHQADLEYALFRFERHYYGAPLRRLVPDEPQHPARVSYDQVGRIWVGEIRPLLHATANHAPDAATYHQLRSEVDAFVERVDRMVSQLEQRAESYVQLLRGVQGACLFTMLLVIGLTVRFLRREVVRPLRELLSEADEVRQGRFGGRIEHTGPDELGQLGLAFNRMAEDLSQLYGDLERRVRDKTRALEYSNRSLELMYRSLSHLHDGSLARSNYTGTLREMEQLLGLGRGSLCLLDRSGRKGFQLADSRHDPKFAGPLCDLHSCAECLAGSGGRARLVAAADGSQVLAVALYDGEEIHALLQVTVPKGVQPQPWQIQLVEAIGRHLGIAIASQRRGIQSRRLALLEERATIARELHDSLAQALSFLKIQVSRLRAALRNPARKGEIEAALQDLHDGLNDAYGHLRELLTTFRIGRGGDGLAQALEETVAGIAARGTNYIELENRLADGELSINEEVHVLQIVREALCNVVRHAQASRAWVRLDWTKDHCVQLVVRDNGVGIGANVRGRSEHYGLAIMRERARQLNGHLGLSTLEDGGTEVGVCFRPAAQAPERGGAEAELEDTAMTSRQAV